MNLLLRAFLASVALLCVAVFPAACEAQPPIGRMQEVTGTLNLSSGGICSATAVSNTAILSAAHCFRGDPVEVRFRGILYRITKIIDDGHDHVLVVLDGDLGKFARMGPSPRLNQDVWIIGNPNGLPQLLRRAYITKVAESEIFVGCPDCWRGDSGAAIFDASGRIIGVVSAGNFDGPFAMTVAFPFAFTEAQWRAIK